MTRLIDADELKEQFAWCEVCRLSIIEINKIIDNAPTVELTETEVQEVLNKRCMTAVANEYLIALHGKRPQGEWIPQPMSCRDFVCSNCGGSCWYYDVSKYVEKSKYCPNCGADMREDNET